MEVGGGCFSKQEIVRIDKAAAVANLDMEVWI